MPDHPVLSRFRTRLTSSHFPNTQWEAWLALYHRKVLIIAVPEQDAIRDEKYVVIEELRNHLKQHLERLAAIERFPEIKFVSADRLIVEILRSKLYKILAKVGSFKRSNNIPLVSIGGFKGREDLLDDLYRSLGSGPDSADNSPVTRILSGRGGVSKTRLTL